MARDIKTPEAPLVSVVMSVYNGAQYLRLAIESILNQTYTNIEFIIIDDGSTDSSLRIIQSYKDNRIIVISRKNKGLIASLNEGFKKARGKFIARHDADDMSMPTRLEKQVQYLQAYADCVVVGTLIDEIDENSSPAKRNIISNKVNNGYLELSLPFFNPIAHGSVLLRRSAVRKSGGYDKQWFLVEDYELWSRMVQFGRIGVVSEVLYQYRVHSLGVSISLRHEQEEQVLRLKGGIFKKLYLSPSQKYFITKADWLTLFKFSLKHFDMYAVIKLFHRSIIRKDERRALLVSFARTIGGGEIYMKNLRSALIGWGEIDFLVPNSIGQFLSSGSNNQKVKIYPSWLIPLDFKGAFQLKKIIFRIILKFYKAKKYDVINTQHFDGAFMAAVQGMGPVLCTAHAHLIFDHKVAAGVQNVLKSVTRIVYVARDLHSDLTDLHVPERKMEFVPNGVSGEGLVDLDIRRQKTDIVWVGRVEQVDKNPKLFIEIAELAQRNKAPYVFVMYGTGTALSELKEYTKKNNIKNIRFAGFEANKTKLYRNARVLCITSVTEAMPLNMLEAFAAAVPVVSTSVGDVASVLVSSEAGLISPPTAQDFLSSIKNIVNNPRYMYSARTAYSEHYNLGTMGRRMEVIFDSLSNTKL